MMLTCSGGTSSPRLSRSLLPPQSSPVVGLNAIPTVLRSPFAKIRPPEPSGLNCVTAARIESRSSHRLHDEPAATYILPSGPNRMVRVEWPPPPGIRAIVSPSAAPGRNRFTVPTSATYIVSLRNAMPNDPLRPVATVTGLSATPSWFASVSLTITPDPGCDAYTALPGPSARKRTPSRFCANTAIVNPGGSRSGCSWPAAGWGLRQAMAITAMLIATRIHSLESCGAFGHPLAARQRLRGGPLDLCGDIGFHVQENFFGRSFFLQILLVQPDRVALAPFRKQLGRKRFAGFALVVGRMAPHAERFSDQQRGAVPRAATIRRHPRRGKGVEHVVAVEERSPYAVARRPVLEIGGEMVLFDTRAQGHLIVLDDENGGDSLHRGEVRPFVRRGGLGGSVAHPGERHARLALDLERQRQPRDHWHHVADMRDRLQHAVRKRSDVEIAAPAGGIGGREIGAQHVGDRHPHLAAGRSVADHRRDDVQTTLECVHRSDRDGLFAGAEPRLGNHAGAHPALQLDVMEARAQQAAIQLELGVRSQGRHDPGALGITFDRGSECPDQRGIRLPVDVFRRVECGEPLHG